MELTYADGRRFELSLRIPPHPFAQAEVRGHGPGQEVLQSGKKDVDIVGVEPVGSYAIQPQFLRRARHRDLLLGLPLRARREPRPMWAEYLQRLAAAGASREVDTTASPAARAAAAPRTDRTHARRHAFRLRAGPRGGEGAEGGGVFESVAPKYDLMNDLMSLGLHRCGRRSRSR